MADKSKTVDGAGAVEPEQVDLKDNLGVVEKGEKKEGKSAVITLSEEQLLRKDELLRRMQVAKEAKLWEEIQREMFKGQGDGAEANLRGKNINNERHNLLKAEVASAIGKSRELEKTRKALEQEAQARKPKPSASSGSGQAVRSVSSLMCMESLRKPLLTCSGQAAYESFSPSKPLPLDNVFNYPAVEPNSKSGYECRVGSPEVIDRRVKDLKAEVSSAIVRLRGLERTKNIIEGRMWSNEARKFKASTASAPTCSGQAGRSESKPFSMGTLFNPQPEPSTSKSSFFEDRVGRQDKIPDAGTFKCVYCKRVFEKRVDLSRHVAENHYFSGLI